MKLILVLIAALFMVACQSPTSSKSAKSSNADLKALAITSYALSPAFVASTTSYTVTVPATVNAVTITAEAAQSAATVTGTGSRSLTSDSTSLEVTVKAEDGTTKTYTVSVTKNAWAWGSVASGVLSVDASKVSGNLAVAGSSRDYFASIKNGLVSAGYGGTITDTTAGTGDGFTKLTAGDVDLIWTSRTMKTAEANALTNPLVFQLGYYAVVLVVNTAVAIDDVATDADAKAAGATATTWKAVNSGLPENTIKRYYPASSTLAWQVVAETYWSGEAASSPTTFPTLRGAANVTSYTDYAALATALAADTDGVGFLPFTVYEGLSATTKASLKVLKLAGVAPSATTIAGATYSSGKLSMTHNVVTTRSNLTTKPQVAALVAHALNSAASYQAAKHVIPLATSLKDTQMLNLISELTGKF